MQANRRINLPDGLTDLTCAPTLPPFFFPSSVSKLSAKVLLNELLTYSKCNHRKSLSQCVSACCDYVVMIFHRFGISAAFYGVIRAQRGTGMLEGRCDTDTPIKYLEKARTHTRICFYHYLCGRQRHQLVEPTQHSIH